MSSCLRPSGVRRRALTAFFLCGASLIFASSIFAQTPPSPEAAATPQAAARTEEEDALVAQRRMSAMLLITTLADEARAFRNEALRARVQARAADALWETDEERARTLFRRAWEAAETSDAESARRTREEIARQMRGGSGAAVIASDAADLRGEVLRLASRRDRALGEEMLARLIEAEERASETSGAPPSNPAANSPRRNPTEATTEDQQRLMLALRLLEDGDTERALTFAAPALSRATMWSILFLSALRERDAAAADTRFAGMLQRISADATSEATTVSLLSSYVLTPFLFITPSRRGMSSSQMRGMTPAPDIPRGLRAQFFRVAAQILLRPILPANDDRSYAGREGTYFIIARLLPAFEQYAPEHAPALRAQLGALTPDAPENFRNGTDPSLTRGLVPESEQRDELRDTLERIERTSDASERERLHIAAAQTAAMRGDERAREYADRITNADARGRVRAFADFALTQRAVGQRDADEILRRARAGDLTPMQRVWAFTQAANVLKRTDRGRALETLEEALRDARRAEGADRPRTLAAVITQLLDVDAGRVWELMPELVRAANAPAAEGFTGEDAQVVALLQVGGSSSAMGRSAADFDLVNLFERLAEIDLLRATEYARSFTGDAPRAVSTLAIARAELNRLKTAETRP